MPRSTATVETEHASRYLQQLCKHWGHKFTVEFTPLQGRIDLGEGRIVDLSATDKSLKLKLEASDIARLQEIVADHVVRFAFREELTFDWHPVD